MAAKKELVPTITVTINRETRQKQVRIENCEGISACALDGIDFEIGRAMYQYHLATRQKVQRDSEKVQAALNKQAGDGRVIPSSM